MFNADNGINGRELYTLCDIDLGVSATATTITADEIGATYQWVDCNNNNAPIAGAINISFTPTVTGNYACLVNNGNCESLTVCNTIVVNTTSLNDLDHRQEVNIYPNPASHILNIKTNLNIQSIQVFDAQGKLVLDRLDEQIDISAWKSGFYNLRVATDQGVSNHKFIKQ